MLIRLYISFICLISINLDVVVSIRKYGKEELKLLRDEAKKMFDHAYSGYMRHAFPYDELRPLTCDGIDTWGSYSLTLIDALDTLAVMGNYSEFRRVANLVTARADFDSNINVSVFETNIRIVGGLLSAHLLSHKAGMELEPGWPCNGPLLRLAEDLATRLLPAFNTKTGMPYGTVNLRHGVPPGETSVTCTAGVGTYIIEFGTLSRLTGDPVYEEVALNALYSLFEHRSSIGLFGNHLDVQTGRWTAQDSGIGGGVDSLFEYLVKGSLLLGKPELRAMFDELRGPIERFLNKRHWYVWASMTRGHVTLPVFQSLEAYWPGVLALIGDMENAVKTLVNYAGVWKQLGFTPEVYNIGEGEAGPGRECYPLRPELAESAMLLYRVTQDPAVLDIGVDILTSIQHSARTPCGYATIKDTRDHTQDNRMESFFLAETTKYLYLLFDPDNFIHNDGGSGTPFTLPSGRQCVLDAGGYIFNTEAHPIDPGALQCCYDWEQRSSAGKLHFDLFKGQTVDFLNPSKKAEVPPRGEAEKEAVSASKGVKSSNLKTLNLDPDTSLEQNDATSLNQDSEGNPGDLRALNQEISDDKEVNRDVKSIDQGLEVKGEDNIKLLDQDSANKGTDSENSSLNLDLDDKGDENELKAFNQDLERILRMLEEKQTRPVLEPPSNHTISHSSVEEDKEEGEGEVEEIRPSEWEDVVTEKLDPQQLLERVRSTKHRHLPAGTSFQLLTCPAHSLLTRISVSTLFYN